MEEEKKSTPIIRLIENPATFELVIPEPVEAKIRHLCSRIHDVEWSGTLFYKVEGSFDDGTFKATCLDICVMDVGSSVFTDFDDNEDIISYRVNHPELLQENVYEGLIHSHNKMPTFFSGTDTATLKQEGKTLNHFLSLIVNNAGTYTAKITRKIVKETTAKAKIKYTEKSHYNTFQNVRIDFKDKTSDADRSEKREEIIIEAFTFNINKESSPERFAEVDDRLNVIKDRRNRRNSTRMSAVMPVQEVFGRTPDPVYRHFPTTGNSYDKSYKKPSAKKEIEEEEDFTDPTPLCLIETFDPELIKSLCAQLITGSIFANDKIAFEVWAKGLDVRYAQRFGDFNDEKVQEQLQKWIGFMVNQLIYTRDEELENRCLQNYGTEYGEEDFAEVCAYDMISFLADLPDSKVKKMMLNELSEYLPNDVSEYF